MPGSNQTLDRVGHYVGLMISFYLHWKPIPKLFL